MSSSKTGTSNQLPPLVVQPIQTHKSTLIILHGRGSTAQKFAEPLLTHPVSPQSTSLSTNQSLKSFRDHLPNTRFVFPTAPLRRAVVFNRSLIHQWFDNWFLHEPEVKQHLQIAGLRESTEHLHELLKAEVELVGAKNVVLIGLSQGCATSLIATMLWDGEPFGGLVGMCGWLPFRNDMQELVGDEGLGDETEPGNEFEDIFERDYGDAKSDSKLEQVVQWLREEIQIGDSSNTNHASPAFRAVPVFMGHGTEDEKVPCTLGKLAADLLRNVEVDVEWHEYERLGHWYSADMLRDIIKFLGRLEG